ncbi:hypothetical protein BBJ28_00016614 [Nothophytophthora sp. Chile5]|nr:hypothetical protein BBJ28_00016614 [Nothophytophthora sp. Chile5]
METCMEGATKMAEKKARAVAVARAEACAKKMMQHFVERQLTDAALLVIGSAGVDAPGVLDMEEELLTVNEIPRTSSAIARGESDSNDVEVTLSGYGTNDEHNDTEDVQDIAAAE